MDINALSFTAPFSARQNAKSAKTSAQTGFAALMEQTAAAGGTAASSLETMLKAKYPKKDKVEIKKKDDDKEKKEPAAVLEDAGRIYDAQGIVQVVAETTGTVSAPAESEKAEGAVDVRA